MPIRAKIRLKKYYLQKIQLSSENQNAHTCIHILRQRSVEYHRLGVCGVPKYLPTCVKRCVITVFDYCLICQTSSANQLQSITRTRIHILGTNAYIYFTKINIVCRQSTNLRYLTIYEKYYYIDNFQYKMQRANRPSNIFSFKTQICTKSTDVDTLPNKHHCLSQIDMQHYDIHEHGHEENEKKSMYTLYYRYFCPRFAKCHC